MACEEGHNMKQQGYVSAGRDKDGNPIQKEYWVCQNAGCSHTEQR